MFALIRNHAYYFQCGAINHLHTNFRGRLNKPVLDYYVPWTNNYVPQFHLKVITNPCPNPKACLAHLRQQKGPQYIFSHTVVISK